MWKAVRFPFYLWLTFTVLLVGMLTDQYYQGGPVIYIQHQPPTCEVVVVKYHTASGYPFKRAEILCPGPYGKVMIHK